MSKHRHELKIYKHQMLMDQFNDLNIRIKAHLYNIGDESFKQRHPKPTIDELDQTMTEIMFILKEDSKSIIHI